MPSKGDARHKLDQLNRKKGRSTSSSRSKSQSKDANRNVKDLRQIIKKKSPNKRQDRRDSNETRSRHAGKKDLREINKRLGTGGKPQTGRSTSGSRDPRIQLTPAIAQEVVKAAMAAVSNFRKPHRTISSGSNISSNNKKPQRPLYVPPHLKNQHSAAEEPRVIVLAPGASRSNLGIDNQSYRHQYTEQGAAVLISNLTPNIIQSEIIELFGDIGTLTAVKMINQTTALVSYQNSSDAVRAVKVYNNRLLDGKPMVVNMMPTMSD